MQHKQSLLKRKAVPPYEYSNESSGTTPCVSPPRRRRSNLLQRLMSSVVAGSSTPPLEYEDLGDCEHICEYCGALFWFEERLKFSPLYKRAKCSICCRNGSVCLPLPLLPPPAIKDLFCDSTFMHDVRAYNSMFSMTSFGAEVDETINSSRGPYVFKVSGQVSHWLGSLCPPPNQKPCYLQMYIYDTHNEIANRMRFFDNSSHSQLSPDIVSVISDTLSSCNEYARLFKSATDLCTTDSIEDFQIRLYNGCRQRLYEPPAPGTLGAIVRENDPNATEYDIIIHSKDGLPQRVSRLHSSYMPLQYPLLFPFAEQGWSTDLRLHLRSSSADRKLTMNMYYSYVIHDRESIYTHLLKAGRLFQQYLVDAYICIEQCRLQYINDNQNLFRSEYLSGIHDAISRGDTEGREIGKRVFLPSSFIGSPRYMYKHYQDALAICRVHGNPQYFIIFTCNAKWPEITRHLRKVGCAHAEDRPDIIARVFQLKVKSFIKFLRSGKPFGTVTADVDNYIMAEIPDPTSNPTLYKIVAECMLHGPCGLLNPSAPCMRDGKCTKYFPKTFETTTYFDENGNVHYRRPCNGHRVLKNNIAMDNGYIVPFNKTLCVLFNAHINVEYCGWSMLIKYLFKYISKGADRVKYTITQKNDISLSTPSEIPSAVNEIQKFVDGRYICPHESAWRILNFAIHSRKPLSRY